MRYLLLLPLLFACSGGQLAPKTQRAVDSFQCYVDVLAPYTDEVLDTAELVRDVIQGKADVSRVLALLGCTAREIREIGAKLEACTPRVEPVVEEG